MYKLYEGNIIAGLASNALKKRAVWPSCIGLERKKSISLQSDK